MSNPYSFWGNLRALLWGLLHCKRHEVETDTGVILDRRTHVSVAWQMMRMSVLPYRLYEFAPGEPTRTMTWNWRTRTLLSRQVDNPHERHDWTAL